MSLEAGSVFTILAGKLDKSAFVEFDAANKRSAASAQAAEGRVRASSDAMAKAQAQAAASATASARKTQAANEQIAASAQASSDAVAAANKRSAESSKVWSGVNRQAADSMATLGTAAKYTAAGGVLVAGAAIYYVTKKAVDFNRELRNINSLAGLSEQQLKAVGDELLAMAPQVGQTPATLARGMYQLVSSGFNARDSLIVLRASAIAATAGLSDTGTAATVIAGALNAYGLSAEHAGHVSDILFQTVNRGVVTFPQLAQVIGPVLPFAARLGVGLDQVGAAMSTLTKEGVPAAEAATAIKNAFSQFLKNPKALAEAIHQTGFESGAALIRAKGFEGALQALWKATGGNSVAFKRLFPDIRAATAAFDLTGKSARMAGDDLRYFTDKKQLDGVTGRVFTEQSKSDSVQLQKLAAGAQAFATAVGTAVLPELARLADGAGRALQAFTQGGGAHQIGSALTEGLSTVGHVVQDVAPYVRDFAGALLDVARALDLGSASHIEAILAAYLGFEAVQFVVPPVLALGAAIKQTATAAAEASTLSEFFANAPFGPVGLLAGAVGALAAGFVLLGGNERSEAQAAQAVTAAKEAEAHAMQDVNDAVLAAADSTFAAGHADDQLRQAKRQLADVAARYGKDSKQYAAALEAEHEAALRDTAAHQQLQRAKEQVAQADQRAQQAARKTIDQARQLLNQRLQDAARQFFNPSTPGVFTRAQLDAATIRAWQDYNAAVQSVARGSAAAMLSQMQLTRVLNGESLVSDRAAQSVAGLSRVWDDLSRSKQRALSLEPQNDLAQVGALAAQLPKSETINILTKADTAREQIAGLTAAIHGIPQQTIVDILTSAEPERVKVEALKAAIAGMPARTVTQILSSAASEQVKVEAFAAAVRGVPARAITTVLADGALDARGQVAALEAAIGALPSSKTVTLTTVTNNIVRTVHDVVGAITGHASGRGPGAREASLVGEGADPREYVINRRTGRGFITRGPMLVGLSDDDYVIPTEQRYAGRAIGLFASLARDLGIPGFAHGRAPKHAKSKRGPLHHTIPGKIDPLSLPLSDLQSKEQAARSALDKDRSAIASLPAQISTTEGEIRDIQRRSTRTAAQRANKADDLHRAQAKLARQKAELARARRDGALQRTALDNLQRELRIAKDYQARIDKQTDLANLAQQDMTIADNSGDEAGFGRARDRRLSALRALQQLVEGAQRHVKVDSAYWRQLQGQINQATIDQQDTANQQPQDTAGQEFTDAEQQQLDRLNADVALAALTPDVADDQAAQQRLVDFLGGVLAEVQADPTERGGYQAITDLAQQLKTARDNLAALTAPTQDMQAQLDQANARAADAQAQAQIAQQALSVFAGSGDIGAGGPNARAAAAAPFVQNNYMLHPSDPAVMRTIGEASVAGIGFQGGRRSPRGGVLLG